MIANEVGAPGRFFIWPDMRRRKTYEIIVIDYDSFGIFLLVTNIWNESGTGKEIFLSNLLAPAWSGRCVSRYPDPAPDFLPKDDVSARAGLPSGPGPSPGPLAQNSGRAGGCQCGNDRACLLCQACVGVSVTLRLGLRT